MPLFHFHVEDGQPAVDPGGFELPDLAAAKCEAIQMAGRIICDAAGAFWDRAEWSMTVTDESGLTLFNLQIVGTDAPAAQTIAPLPSSASRQGC
jgi:hypothetical protein